VLQEGGLQLLPPEAARQGLAEALGLPVRLVRAGGPSGRLLDLTLHVVELEAERGKVERGEGFLRGIACRPGLFEVVHAEGEAGERQPAQAGLARAGG